MSTMPFIFKIHIIVLPQGQMLTEVTLMAVAAL